MLKEAHMQVFSRTIISTGTSNQMATFLGLAEQNWLFGIKQAGTELRDHPPLPEIPDHCAEAAGHMGQGLSSILHMWDIPSASGVSSKKRGNGADNQILRFSVSDKRVGLHVFAAWVCRSPFALGVPDPSAERRRFALTAICRVLSVAGEGRNPSVNVNISIKQPQEQRRAEFPLLHSFCTSSKKLILPGALSQARNAQRDDFNAKHEPAEVPV